MLLWFESPRVILNLSFTDIKLTPCLEWIPQATRLMNSWPNQDSICYTICSRSHDLTSILTWQKMVSSVSLLYKIVVDRVAANRWKYHSTRNDIIVINTSVISFWPISSQYFRVLSSTCSFVALRRLYIMKRNCMVAWRYEMSPVLKNIFLSFAATPVQ